MFAVLLCFCLCWDLGLWPQSCEGEAYGGRDPIRFPPHPGLPWRHAPSPIGSSRCVGGTSAAASALRLAAARPEGSVSQVTAGPGAVRGPGGGAVRGGVCAGWACGPSGLITFLLTPPVCDSSVLCPTRRKSAASCALCRRDGELGGGELRCSRVSVLRSASGPTAAISCLTYLNRNLMRE